MPYSGHEDQLQFVRRGLGSHNLLIGLYGGTYQASNSTVATWKTTNTSKQATPSLTHEDQQMLVRRTNVSVDGLSAASIYGNTQVAASNTTATWEAQFTESDGSLPAAYLSGMGDD